MKTYFDTQIKPLNDDLGRVLGDEEVNNLNNYRDDHMVLHIKDVGYEWAEYHLINGEWIEQFDSKNKPF